MAESKELKQLKDYFASRGYKPITPYELEEKPDLAIHNGKSTIFVKVLSQAELASRNALLSAILQSASFLGRANKVYVAIPKVYAPMVNGKVLQDRGLGMLIFNGRGVSEAVPARFFEVEAPSAQRIASFVEELRLLKERLSGVERSIEHLSAQLATLREEVAGLKLAEPKPRIKPSVKPEIPAKVKATAELPSFFKDNPWVDILSKRGREEE